MNPKALELLKNHNSHIAKDLAHRERFLKETTMLYHKDREVFEERRKEFVKVVEGFSVEKRAKWESEIRNELESTKGFDKILRWDYDDTYLSKLSPVNEGKEITDNNPLFNLASVDELDLSSENEPHPAYSGTQGSPGVITTFSLPTMYEVIGDMFGVRMDISKDIIKGKVNEISPPPIANERFEDVDLLKSKIKKKAKELGFGLIGFTKVDRRYIADGRDEYAPYQNIIVLGMEMDKEEVDNAPNYQDHIPTYTTYSDAGREVHNLADFIRDQGWQCISRVALDGNIKLVPHAVNAGIVNFGTSANSIGPQYGTRMRMCCIVLEADLPVDKPRDLNVEEFCSRCRMCQKSCPALAIPKEAIRHRGTYRRRVRDIKCFSSMIAVRGTCAICIKVCPFSKFGYDKCMDSLPRYYDYNILDYRGMNDGINENN